MKTAHEIVEELKKGNTPILGYGTFGLHILQHCSGQGKYFYVGTVPAQLDRVCGTEPELLEAFFAWLDTCSVKDKKELIPLLRNDVFVMYLNRISHWA